MESACSVTRLSIALWLQHTHVRTPIHTQAHKHTHTPQSMITHQGFRVESWSLTYRCYISVGHWGWSLNDPSVHPFSPGQDCCTQPLDHNVYSGVQILTLLLPAVASLDKEYAYTFSLSHQGEAESSYQFQTYVSMGRQSHASQLGL